MGRIGGAVVVLLGVGVLMIGMRPAWDAMFGVMNTTSGLTSIESMVWRSLPIAIPVAAVVGSIIGLVRRHDNRKEGGYTEWRD